MSDSPRTTLSHWQELQQTKCELAAAQEKIAELRQNLQTAEGAIQDRITERDAALKRIAELEPDAERYRWLRKERFDDGAPSVQSIAIGCIGVTLDGHELDAAIDAARAKDKPLWNGYDDGLPHHNR